MTTLRQRAGTGVSTVVRTGITVTAHVIDAVLALPGVAGVIDRVTGDAGDPPSGMAVADTHGADRSGTDAI